MSKISRLRSAPWLLIAQAAIAANAHWKQLEPGDRARLTQLVKRSKGVPSNLTAREREELKLLVGRLELAGFAREMVPFVARGAKRRRGRR